MITKHVLTEEDIKLEMQRYWDAYIGKQGHLIRDFYSPRSSVFSTTTGRWEPGMLAVTRREREFYGKETTVNGVLNITDVMILGTDVAVVSFNFEFYVKRPARPGVTEMDLQVPQGRGTMVFERESDGKLRIVHEHLSSVRRR
jgi:hypothetical protein